MSALPLALTELEQDEVFPSLSANQISSYLDESIRFGRESAEGYAYDGNLTRWMDRMIHAGVRIRFADRKNGNHTEWVRAQYRRKPPSIYIYRFSLEQLKQFFHRSGYRVSENDLIALHLFHEWFHHLEYSRLGRTDLQLPKAVKKRWGPLTLKQPLPRLREIAAHAFTQKAMDLPWFPLWLDHLLLLSEQGWSKTRIREHFHQIKNRYRQIMEPEERR
ncbi:hypothetical protein CHM34_05560 [Paludifilum halophilum]|uniref:Uncharacterized protein n=1 Tax=Paludifilum halophilum TaxID=1642702 RepID=A0A235B9P9_9BACL|nr:hypothetical protein CHM34_05560 [Paludifilum halophilum]